MYVWFKIFIWFYCVLCPRGTKEEYYILMMLEDNAILKSSSTWLFAYMNSRDFLVCPSCSHGTAVWQCFESSTFMYKPLLAVVLLILYNSLLWFVCIAKPVLIMNSWRPREVKNTVTQQGGRKKVQTSDSSSLEIIVTGNFILCDLLQLRHFCYHNLSTDLKMIHCHFYITKVAMFLISMKSATEGFLHPGGHTVFMKRI